MVTKRTFWTAIALEIAIIIGTAAVSAQYSMNQLLSYGTQALIRYFSINDVLNVKAYGALGNGLVCDDPSIQSTINAACVAGDSVYFPAGNYKTCQPLIDTCSSGVLTLFGDDHSTATISPSFVGPAIVVAANNLISSLNSGVVTSTALVSGGPAGASSLFWTNTTPFTLDLQEALGNASTPYLSGKSAGTIRAFFKTSVTGTAMTLLSSSGAVDYWKGTCSVANTNIAGGTSLCTGVGAMWLDTDNKLHCYFNTTGNGVQYATSSGTFSTNTTQEADCEYDGAHIGAALNGTWGTLVAATGTLVQRPDENFSIGQMVGYWPHIIAQANQFQGSIYDPEIANVARQTLGSNYSQHTTVYTFDSHTVYGTTFSQQINMPTTTQPVVFGSDYFNGAASIAWSTVHNYGLGCCGGHYNVNKLRINGGTIGVDVADADVSITHVKTDGQTYIGVDTSPNASFNSNINDLRGVIGSSAMGQIVAEGGITAVGTPLYTQACGQLCDYINNGIFRDVYAAAQSNSLWGIVCSQGCALSDVVADNENGGFCSGITMERSPTQLTTAFVVDDNSQISACAAPISPIAIEGNNNSGPFVFRDSQINWTNPAPPAIVHMPAGSSSGTPTLVFEGDIYNGQGAVPGIAYSDAKAIIFAPPLITALTTGLNGAQIPQAFGLISGSIASTTGITNGTTSITSVASTSGWQAGMGIAVLAAGPTSTISAPAQPTGLAFGGGAGHTYAYKCAFMDGLHGLSAASVASANVTNGAALSFNTIYNEIAITPPAAASGAYSVGCWESKDAGAYTFVTFGPVTSQSVAPNSIYLYDYGQSIASTVWPSTPPASATADDVSTTITSISGTTFTLAAALTQSITATLFHDDCNLINQADVASVKVQLPAATYACSEPFLWGAAGANSFPNIEGAGAHQSIIQTTHAMGGLPVILLINPNSASLHDFGIVGDNSSLPLAGIESFVNNPTGFGAVGHSEIRNVEIASSNTNAILNGVVLAAANGFDENNEAWKLSNNEIMQVREAGVLIDHYNSFQNEIVGGNFILGGTCGIETFGGNFYIEGASNLSANFAANANDICIGHGKYGHDFGIHQTMNEANMDVLRIDPNAVSNAVNSINVTLDGDNFGANPNDNTIDIEPSSGWYLKIANSHIGEGLANATYLLKNVRAILEDNVLGVATINCSGVSGVVTTLNNIYTSGAPTFTLSNGCTQSAIGSGGGGTPAIQSWPLSQNPVTGTSFYCNNCDPPTNPPSLCSSSFSKIGSNVRVTNGQYVCGP